MTATIALCLSAAIVDAKVFGINQVPTFKQLLGRRSAAAPDGGVSEVSIRADLLVTLTPWTTA
jgi:hypothetical protein